MWELDDARTKEKIAQFARNPGLVSWSLTAQSDIAGIAGVTSTGVLEAILDHLTCNYAVHADHMKNGDLAYIFRCFLGTRRGYVKVKFISIGGEERMHVFSAHLDR